MEYLCKITESEIQGQVSSSTEALDSEQARHTTRRILQHTRSLHTDSPVPQILTTDREYRLDSGLSDRYITRTPITMGVDRSSYMGYMTEHDDYATLGSITPTSSSVGMFVRPKTKSVSSYGSHMPKDKVEGERGCIYKLTSYNRRECCHVYRYDRYNVKGIR